MPLQISDALRKKLIARRAEQLEKLREGSIKDDPHGTLRYFLGIQESIEGIHLCGSIGFDLYLTFDGRILLWKDSGWGGRKEPTLGETHNLACMALGLSSQALFNDLPELLGFLPQRPEGEPVCPFCAGARILDYPNGHPRTQVCEGCQGLGWGQPKFENDEGS